MKKAAAAIIRRTRRASLLVMAPSEPLAAEIDPSPPLARAAPAKHAIIILPTILQAANGSPPPSSAVLMRPKGTTLDKYRRSMRQTNYNTEVRKKAFRGLYDLPLGAGERHATQEIFQPISVQQGAR